uniref:NADH-ubiquinone oxidoreductase chain 2 n=1 Tax=Xenos yangi TaxID=2980483 RepID=A0A977Q796_9NEOP|nr:NADH dehydrogenase subunit 2 [Xenos yangi]
MINYYFLPMSMSILMTLISNSWIIMWMGMELNLMSILPLMNKNKSNKSIECSMKYFLIQSFSSLLLIFLLSNTLIFKMSSMFPLEMTLFFKMGLMPFHFWYPDLFTKMSWNISSIMFTMQKLAPLWMLSIFLTNNMLLHNIIIMNLLVSSLGMWNEKNIQKLMAFSSISHSSWMMSSMMFSKFWWMMYWSIYTLSLLPVLYFFKQMNLLTMNQFLSINMTPWTKMMIFLNLLSLGGYPPLLGFIPKWFILLMLNNKLLLLMMTLLSSFSLYIYMKMWILSLLISKNISLKKMNLPMYMPMIILLSTFLWMMI